jgi:hypothetical protein
MGLFAQQPDARNPAARCDADACRRLQWLTGHLLNRRTQPASVKSLSRHPGVPSCEWMGRNDRAIAPGRAADSGAPPPIFHADVLATFDAGAWDRDGFCALPGVRKDQCSTDTLHEREQRHSRLTFSTDKFEHAIHRNSLHKAEREEA